MVTFFVKSFALCNLFVISFYSLILLLLLGIYPSLYSPGAVVTPLPVWLRMQQPQEEDAGSYFTWRFRAASGDAALGSLPPLNSFCICIPPCHAPPPPHLQPHRWGMILTLRTPGIEHHISVIKRMELLNAVFVCLFFKELMSSIDLQLGENSVAQALRISHQSLKGTIVQQSNKSVRSSREQLEI